MAGRYVTPALVGGIVIGVLSALPVVAAGNLCCCLWVLLGGAAAAYLLQQNQDAPLTAGDGALVGVIAGAAGAVVYLVLSIPITLLVAPMERALLDRLSESGASMPPELRTAIEGAGGGVRLLLSFLFMLFIGPLFATLGGLLGAMAFRKPVPAPLTPPAPPPATTPPSTPPAPPPADPAGPSASPES